MASSVPATPKLSVDDILAFSEADLVQYMKQNHHSDGGFDLDFEGWENLPKDQRDQLAERLRVGAQKANDAAPSCPVDPGQLAAKLEDIADNQDVLPQALSRPSRYSRCSTAEVDLEEENKKSETIAYNTLANDGGRPVYPIDLLEEVSKNPVEHREVLHPWQDYPDASTPRWGVFQTQLRRWQDFRKWQEDNREMFNEEEFAAFVEEEKRKVTECPWYAETESQYIERLRVGFTRRQGDKALDNWEEAFAAYVERTKQYNVNAGRMWSGMTVDEFLLVLRAQFKRRQAEKGINDGDARFSVFVEEEKQRLLKGGHKWPGMTEDEYLQMLKIQFNQQQGYRYWEKFYWLREDHGRGGFPEYADEVRRRLARHGFTRTFQLDKDPKRQDKLTTWIEYLNYEYSWYDRYSGDVERLQPQHDEAWQKLVESGVLRPSETEEYLRTTESSFRRQGEQDAARKAVESAKSAAGAVLISTQNEPQRSSLTKPVRLQMIRTAHARLDAAKESLSATKKRGDLITNFIRGTFDYQTAQRNVKRQNIRLQWILEQVPQIEAEVNESKAAEGSSNAERGTKRRPRRDQEDEVATERKPTKRRRNEQSLHLDGRTGSTAQTKGRSKRSHRNDTVDDEPPPKRFRVGSRDSGFQRQASGDADATSTGDRQASGVCASGRQGGGKATMKTRLAPSTPLPQPTDHPQLPLIGVESQSKTTESSSDGRKRRKRGLEHRRDEIIKDRSLKRQRREALDECGHDGTIDDKTLSKRYKNGRQPRRSHLQTPDEAETATIERSQEFRIHARSKDIGKQEGGHQAVAPLRRSARIAARQKPCKSPVVLSGSPGARMSTGD